MKTLYLLRHAKADKTLNDMDRELTARGGRQAESLGRWMSEKGLLPDRIISSPARRSKLTAKIVSEQVGYQGSIRFEQNLYGTYGDAYVDVITDLKNEYDSVMIVGHNPAISDVVTILTGDQRNMSTCMLVCLEIAIGKWIFVKDGKGILKWVQIPP